jgi:hypothetical protein
MISVNRIVSVSAQVQSANPSVPNFDTPLAAVYLTPAEVTAADFTELVRFYSDASSVASDIGANSAAAKVASAIFAQNPAISRMGIGRLTTAPDLTVELAPTDFSVVGREYRIELVGPTGVSPTNGYVTYTTPASPTPTLKIVVEGISAAIQAVVGTVLIVATEDDTKVICKAATPGLHFSVAANLKYMTQAQTQTQTTLAAELSAIRAENKDWFALTLATGSASEITAASAWVATTAGTAKDLMGVFTTIDTDCLGAGTGDIMSTVKATNNAQCQVRFFGKGLKEQGAAAYLGSCLAYKPGTIDWEYRQLLSVTADDLSETQVNNVVGSNGISGKHGGVFVNVEGTDVTLGAMTSHGDWLDVTRDVPFSVSRMKAALYAVRLNNPKIIFNDKGIAMALGAVRGCLQQDVQDGIAMSSPEPTCSAPKASAISSADYAARLLANVKYSYKYGSSIHRVQVFGTISL